MTKLLELLLALEDVKSLEPYKWQTCDVIGLEAQIAEVAATVRAHALRYAWESLRGKAVQSANPSLHNCEHGVIDATCTICWPQGNIARKEVQS